MSIEERVKKVVSEQLDVSGDIDNNASFIDDLGADEFDCEIPDDQAENITTVQQAIDYVNNNL
ncbi:MAG: acyl carrier protein [Candidatus Ruthia sp.]|nr:acyl carrier protein [Candidatus Ruthturnera sp.]